MNRRSFLRNTGLSFAGLSLLNQDLLAFFADPAWKITMLTNEIGIFTERGGTILFMLSKKGLVVVDSQFADTAPHLIEEMKKKTTKPFRLLINTHHHGDHTAGNIAFKGLVENVVAHENSKKNQERMAKEKKTEAKELFPDKTYIDTWDKKMGNEKVKLHYFGAGHTDGDSLVHFEHANIVHMGDLVFNRRHPFIDKSAGASISNWQVILEKAVSHFGHNTQFVCGHAAPGHDVIVKGADLFLFRDYLGNLMRFTEAEIKAGKSKEEILKNKDIPGSPEWKGDGAERALTAAYTELTAK